MLEQKTDSDNDEEILDDEIFDDDLVYKSEIIEYAESCIDSSAEVYLITWSPSHKELPDCSFNLQHEYSVGSLIDYLQFCSAGCFCVETHQTGFPHYHGWYQIDESKELGRISCIKTLQRFGMIKITKLVSLKINCYSELANGLYYYKKDVYDSMRNIVLNPIISSTPRPQTNFNDFAWLMPIEGRKTMRAIEEKVSQYKYYRNFYSQMTF